MTKGRNHYVTVQLAQTSPPAATTQQDLPLRIKHPHAAQWSGIVSVHVRHSGGGGAIVGVIVAVGVGVTHALTGGIGSHTGSDAGTGQLGLGATPPEPEGHEAWSCSGQR